jgi:hypothetical protein
VPQQPEALVATLPLGTVAYEPETNAKGERLIWPDKLDPLRKPGETYSDVIPGWGVPRMGGKRNCACRA